MTPVERVLTTFLLDTAEAFSRHGDEGRRQTYTVLEEDVRAAMRRAFAKLPTVMVTSPRAREVAQPVELGA